jgi:hypothetical protein
MTQFVTAPPPKAAPPAATLFPHCRLLKECLSGNSRTAMVATISAADAHYYNSVNTLK